MMPTSMLGRQRHGRELIRFAGPWIVFATTAVLSVFAISILPLFALILASYAVPNWFTHEIPLGILLVTHVAVIVAAVFTLCQVKRDTTTAPYQRAVCLGVLSGDLYLLSMFGIAMFARP